MLFILENYFIICSLWWHKQGRNLYFPKKDFFKGHSTVVEKAIKQFCVDFFLKFFKLHKRQG
jgi:hypothetical protein